MSFITVQYELFLVVSFITVHMSYFWQRLLWYCALGAIAGSVICYCTILFRVVPFITVQFGLFLVKFKVGWWFRDQVMVVVLLHSHDHIK